MFKRHQPPIAAFGQASPENMARVLQFVLLTIRMHLRTVPKSMAEVDKVGAKARALWGWKREAWEHIQANSVNIYSEAMALAAIPDPVEAERQLLAHFAMLPGFGVVKSGFAVQLLFGLGGCLDTHNVERYRLNAQKFKDLKRLKTWAARYKQIDYYQKLLHKLGGAEKLWNSWCAYVAEKEAGYSSPEYVSELHSIAILGGSQWTSSPTTATT